MMPCRPRLLSDVSEELAAIGYKKLLFLDPGDGGGRLPHIDNHKSVYTAPYSRRFESSSTQV